MSSVDPTKNIKEISKHLNRLGLDLKKASPQEIAKAQRIVEGRDKVKGNLASDGIYFQNM